MGERVESDQFEIALRNEGEGKNREGKGWGIGIKLFFFFNCCFMYKENVIINQGSETP
jgi:hypothetical protein